MQTEATVATQHGALYINKLCRHFGHKVPVQRSDNKARIDFPFGDCRIVVDENQVHFTLNVADPEDLGRAEQVVAEHFVRMATRDQPQVVWNRSRS